MGAEDRRSKLGEAVRVGRIQWWAREPRSEKGSREDTIGAPRERGAYGLLVQEWSLCQAME